MYIILEGDNLGRVAAAQSCCVSFSSPEPSVATLRWLNSLKQTRRGLCTCAPYYRIFDDNCRPVQRFVANGCAILHCCKLGGGAVGRETDWLAGKTFCPLLLFLAMRGIKGFTFAFGKTVRLLVVLFTLLSACDLLLNCFFLCACSF